MIAAEMTMTVMTIPTTITLVSDLLLSVSLESTITLTGLGVNRTGYIGRSLHKSVLQHNKLFIVNGIGNWLLLDVSQRMSYSGLHPWIGAPAPWELTVQYLEALQLIKVFWTVFPLEK
jgi:hypothetical protein